MRAPLPSRHTLFAWIAAAALAATFVGCAVNPATGRRQLVLVSESQEIAMGKQYDQTMVQQIGLYPDDELQQYVSRLGAELAAGSERPQLEWGFRVVDDPVVNAFALPGGFIYITRGILAHFESEAELVSVLGHEIGHVTGRHSVNQMSKQQLAQIGMVGVMIAAPDQMQQYGGMAQQLAGMLFLKFSRDHERQADDLGLRYLVASNYDPRPMPDVFDTLRRVGAAAGGERLPGWMSTHPLPENRRDRIDAQIQARQIDFTGRTVNRDRFLDAIDGITFGIDPRQGYFRESEFVHPEMEFQLRFPDGWRTANQTAAVLAISPEQDAMVQLGLAEGTSASAALQKFFTQEGVQQANYQLRAAGGLRSAGAGFVVQSQGGDLAGPPDPDPIQGLVLCVEHGGRVFQLVGYTKKSRWTTHGTTLENAVESFDRLRDSRVREARAKRLKIVNVTRTLSIDEFARRYDSTIEPEQLALINGLEPGAAIRAGRRKVVTGGYMP